MHISADILAAKIHKNSYIQQENALRYSNYSILSVTALVENGGS